MSYIPTGLPERDSISGVEIELATIGEGRNLLYLHAGDGADAAAPFVDHLTDSYKVFLPSHPGFGYSDIPKWFSSIDDLAYFYLDFIERYDLRDVVLVGSSFGAWLAAEVAVKCCHRISKIVLASPLGIKIDGREERGITDLFSIAPDEQKGYLFHQHTPSEEDLSRLPEEIVRRITRNRESMALFGWAPTLYNPNLLYRLHRITVPTLILWGDRDKVITRAHADTYTDKIPSARIEVIEQAGHYIPYDQPERFVAHVNSFTSE